RSPSPREVRNRSEALFVTHVRRTAIDVVQIHVERTTVERDDFRHLVREIVHAERGFGVPGQFNAGMYVVRRVVPGVAAAVAVGAGVIDIEAGIPVTPLPGVEQGSADSRKALTLHQIIAAVDGELMRIAGTKHVRELALVVEV